MGLLLEELRESLQMEEFEERLHRLRNVDCSMTSYPMLPKVKVIGDSMVNNVRPKCQGISTITYVQPGADLDLMNKILPHTVTPKDDYVVLHVGTNDIYANADEFENKYYDAVNSIRQTCANVVCSSIVHRSDSVDRHISLAINRKIDQLNEIIQSVAAKEDLSFFNFNMSTADNPNIKVLNRGGLHLWCCYVQ